MDDITIKVTADTTQAETALRRTGSTLQSAAKGGATAPGGGGGLPAQSGWGTAGKQIATAAIGFIAHEGMQTLATVVGNQEGGSRTGQRIATYSSGIIGGATTGAMIGSAIAPGVGTAIGAALGAAAGAALAFAQDVSESSRTIREEYQRMGLDLRSLEHGQASGEQDRAFSRMLGTKSREEQLELVNARINQLFRGSGDYSIINLFDKRRRLAGEEKIDTNTYKETVQSLSMQMGRAKELLRLREELEITPTAPFMEAKAVTDSLGIMGGTIGATVDVADVNQRQLEVLERIYEVINRASFERVDSEDLLLDRATSTFN